MTALTRGALLVLAVVLSTTAVFAQGAPPTLAFVARLTDDSGSAITGQHDFVFTVFDMQTAGSNLWSETRTGVNVGSDGVLFLDLGSVAAMAGTPLDGNILNGSSRWLEISIDGVTSSPRVLLESAPYAIRSGKATDADGLQGHAASYFQRAVVSMCTGAQTIQTINADGSVTCVAAPVYTAGTGLALSVGNVFSVDTTAIQARVTGTCATGAINTINANGTVTCSTATTYTAGTGLSLSAGNQFSVDFSKVQAAITACSAGSAITSVSSNGTPTCIDVTYGAGAGLTLTGQTFAVDTTAIEAKISPSTTVVATMQSTSGGENSGTYGDLATTGPAATVTVPASGNVLVTVTAQIQPNGGNVACMGFQAGATVASDAQALCYDGTTLQASATYLLTGLAAGGMTFTAKYRSSGNRSATFLNRSIIAVPVP